MNNIVKKAKRAFTLVELVIVIAVIAVLSAILIPVFSNVISDSKVAKLKQNLQTATTELILFSAEAGIDYYTPNQIKRYLALKGIDCSKPVEDGYSIWYDQKSFNLRLIENASLFSSSGTAGAGARQIAPDSILDNFGRRPEALTESKDLLLLATDEENIKVLDYIDGVYTKYDEGLGHTYGSMDFSTLTRQVYSIPMLNNAPSEVYEQWESDIDPTTTLYINNRGKLITNYYGNPSKPIRNVIVSRSANIEIQPGVYKIDNVENTSTDFKFDCYIELPENVTSMSDLKIIFANDSLRTIIALSNELDFEDFKNSNVGDGIVTSRPSTAVGDIVHNISSSTGNVVVGGNTNPNIFYDTNLLKPKTESDVGHYEISLETSNTNTTTNTTYVKPQLTVNLEEFKKTVKEAEGEGSIVTINTVKYYERKLTDYCDTVFTATYTVTKNGVSTMKAVKFDVGCGYITDLSIWYNRDDSGNISNKTYTLVGNTSTFNPTVNVALPSGASYLANYKNAKIKIYYQQVRKYYTQKTSDYGAKYYNFDSEVIIGNEQTATNSSKNEKGYYHFTNLTINKNYPDQNKADKYYVDEVIVSKIEVLDASNRVLFTKSYQ